MQIIHIEQTKDESIENAYQKLTLSLTTEKGDFSKDSKLITDMLNEWIGDYFLEKLTIGNMLTISRSYSRDNLKLKKQN